MVVDSYNSIFHGVDKREAALLEKEIQKKTGEIRELNQKLTDMERDKHTEIVKLRLEVCGFKP